MKHVDFCSGLKWCFHKLRRGWFWFQILLERKGSLWPTSMHHWLITLTGHPPGRKLGPTTYNRTISLTDNADLPSSRKKAGPYNIQQNHITNWQRRPAILQEESWALQHNRTISLTDNTDRSSYRKKAGPYNIQQNHITNWQRWPIILQKESWALQHTTEPYHWLTTLTDHPTGKKLDPITYIITEPYHWLIFYYFSSYIYIYLSPITRLHLRSCYADFVGNVDQNLEKL